MEKGVRLKEMNLELIEEHQAGNLVFASVTTPPMVGSTWPRVRSTLESDCFPTLFQGTVSFCLAMD